MLQKNLSSFVLPAALVAVLLSGCGGAQDPGQPSAANTPGVTQPTVPGTEPVVQPAQPGSELIDVHSMALPGNIAMLLANSGQSNAVAAATPTKTVSANAVPTPKQIAQIGLSYAEAMRGVQAARIDWLYQNNSPEYNPGASSQWIRPIVPETAQPIVLGDQGNHLASIGVSIWRGNRPGARSAAYGTQLLDSFNGGAMAAHQPVFRRLVSWLLRREATASLPTSVKVAFVGVNASSSTAGMVKAGVPVTTVNCDFIATPACAANADLLVIGNVADNATLQATVDELLASGKPMLYMHTHGWDSTASDAKILAAMGLQPGDYGGNYWAQDKVSASRTSAANLTLTNQFSRYTTLLGTMANESFDMPYNWSSCNGNDCSGVPGLGNMVSMVDTLGGMFNTINSKGKSIYATPYNITQSLFALWADFTRSEINYPMDKVGTPAAFQKALIADSLVSYVRSSGPAQADLGSFATGLTKTMAVSSADETITLTLADSNGFTALGRLAAAGKTVSITVLNSGNAQLGLRINTQRTGSTRLWENNSYNRPRFLASPAMQLTTGQALQVNSPYGGTLQIAYSNATPGQTVQLRVRGVAKHPFLDASNGSFNTASFVAALNSNQHDWVEIKLPGMEVHSRADMMRQAVNGSLYAGNVDKYLNEIKTIFLEDIHLLAGYVVPGKTLTAHVQSMCSQLGWDCTNPDTHRLPPTQHINVDNYSQCGIGCGGNPYDQAWPLTPRGWGESHEMGHNMQRGLHKIYDDRSTEVSNQVYPLHKDWRMLQELGVNEEDWRVAYRSAFDMIKAAKTEADPIQGAYRRIWSDGTYTAQNGERMAFYMQWVHYWAQRQGNIATGWDLLTLLNLHARQFEATRATDWATNRSKLGYNTYDTKPGVSANDNMLISLSKITQRDQRATFDLWGITYTAAASAQVANFGFAAEPAFFYANTSTNNHATVRRVDMTVASPVWPF